MRILMVSSSPLGANIVRGALAQGGGGMDHHFVRIGQRAEVEKKRAEAAAKNEPLLAIVDWDDFATEEAVAFVEAFRREPTPLPVVILCPLNRMGTTASVASREGVTIVSTPLDPDAFTRKALMAVGADSPTTRLKATVNVELINPFVNACKTVFGTMCHLTVERKDIFVQRDYRMLGDISGIMGLSGGVTGSVAVSLPQKLACRAVANMLGEEPHTHLDTDVCDGVSELTNMISGHAKAALVRTPYHFTISIPSIVTGAGHEVHHKAHTPAIVMVFHCAEVDEDFALQVAIDLKPVAAS